MTSTSYAKNRLLEHLDDIRLALKSYAFRFFMTSALILVLIGLVIFVSLFTFLTLRQSAAIRSSVETEIERVAGVYQQGGVDAFKQATVHAVVEYNITNFYYLLADAEGNKIAGDITQWPRNARRSKDKLVFTEKRVGNTGDTVKMLAVEATMPDGNRILVARNLRLLGVMIQNYSFVVALFFCVSVALCVGLSLIFSWLSMSRLEKFNIGIRRIMGGDLSERFVTSDSRAEPEELARNLNSMLDVITSLMEDVKRVSDNIAHDLRTPLTRHRNNLVAFRNRSGSADQEAIEDLIQETDQLLATFNALLRIARIESGNRTASLDPLDMASLVHDVAELYEPVAADKSISFEVQLEQGIVVSGDRNLLFQAIANLLDNAIKFTPNHGEIGIFLRTGLADDGTPVLDALPRRVRGGDTREETENPEARLASVEIADNGQGADPDNFKKMFQRFYREEQSRGLKPGNGLGLSMVLATMKLHTGAILVRDNKPGLSITLVFPRSRK